MAPDFKSYLATQVIAEQQTVSYRNVSRALKVHVNAAKCMLYEFYERENAKKKESIYATYLIAGTKFLVSANATSNGKTGHMDVDDEALPSSPPPFTSSMLEPSQRSDEGQEDEVAVPIRTISLVREEMLQEVRQQYETIMSIHIYSLSPGRLQDLVTLTDIGRGLCASTFVNEDPLEHNRVYGIIQNPEVRRRKGKRPIIPNAPTPSVKSVKKEQAPKKDTAISGLKTAAASGTKEESRPSSRDSISSKPAKQPSLKRDGSSLFKAFAKQSAQPKVTRQDTDASTNASASGVEDVKMTDAEEEGESEDEALFLDTKTQKPATRKRPSDVKKERDDKAAKLRKMMDSDGEEEEEKALPNVEDASEIGKPPPAAEPGAGTVDPEKDDVDWSDSENERKQDSKPKTKPDEVSTGPKRRRGKRKVMKKRTMKDEDGYLVTKEEEVFESFSEDEPEPEPQKEKVKNAFGSLKSQSSSQKSTASAKGGPAKKGGNIMNFFGKK